MHRQPLEAASRSVLQNSRAFVTRSTTDFALGMKRGTTTPVSSESLPATELKCTMFLDGATRGHSVAGFLPGGKQGCSTANIVKRHIVRTRAALTHSVLLKAPLQGEAATY